MNRPKVHEMEQANRRLEWLEIEHPYEWDAICVLRKEIEWQKSRADTLMVEVEKMITQVTTGPLETAYQMIRKEKEYRRYEQLPPMKEEPKE